MPIHDWTKVRANRFHHFHQEWTMAIARALNRGLLPEGFSALAEQHTDGPEPDVVALSAFGSSSQGGVALADIPVKARIQQRTEAGSYAAKANRIAIHHPDGVVVAIIEIVSPGNKESKHAIRSFLRKVNEFLERGVNVLIVDLFPPSKRDPQGLHALIWEEWNDDPPPPAPGKPLALLSYHTGEDLTAYIEPKAVGDALTDMPVFLGLRNYVTCPLESTYRESWDVYPKALRSPLE